MALSKGGKAGSNVAKLDDARNKRTKTGSSTSKTTANDDGEQPPLATQQEDAGAARPTPKTTSKRVSNRRFDKVKVDRLKFEIANGDYEINYLNVADKFIEHERYA